MNKIAVLSLSCICLCGECALAYPLDPTPRTIDNGGDSLVVQDLGDEHYSLTKTSDGYLLVPGTDGVLYYADESGSPSTFKARSPEKRTGKEKSFLRKLDRKKAFDSHRKNTPRRLDRPAGSSKRADWVPTGPVSMRNDAMPPVLRLPKPASHANGTNRFPVVLVQNASYKNMDSSTVADILGKENYKANGYVGSIKDYFRDQSSGKFVPSFDVFPITLNVNFGDYDLNEYKFVQLVTEALRERSDFNAILYDADNNGEVDALSILYAGTRESANTMGGFQYSLQWDPCGRQSAGNGKKFNTYFVLSQDQFFPSFIHEFSHTMGLSDHYCVYSDACYSDYSSSQYQAPGAHFWDVMATGMYAGNKKRPPSYSAFERNFMGWMEYTILDATADVNVIKPLNTSNSALKIPVEGDADEWFVLENRQLTGWDSSLPANGLLIWHIDYDKTVWEKDAVNDDPAHQHVDVIEAGNIRVTDYYSGFKKESFVDDVFPGSQNVTKYGPFTSWAGKSQGVTLYNITDNGEGLVCFSLKEEVDVNGCAEKVNEVSSASSEISSSSVLVNSSSSAISSNSVMSSSSAQNSSSSVVSDTSSSSVPITSSSVIPNCVEGSCDSAESSSSGTEGTFETENALSGTKMNLSGYMLYIRSLYAGNRTFRLFDSQGRLLMTRSIAGTNETVDLSAYVGKGVFVAQLTIGSSRQTSVIRLK